MGGVPYTSTRCNTCRRRKVKCDETKPQCLRCIKYGHTCTGYEKSRIFIHQSSTRNKGCQEPVHLSKPSSLDLSRSYQVTRLEPKISRFNTYPEIRSQLVNSFIDSHSPSSHYVQNATGMNLLHALPDLAQNSQILDKAVISLCSAFLAKQNRDDQLLHYSSKLYNHSMVSLHGKITSGAKLGKDLLYTTVVFQLYELINCSPPGFMAWIAHVQGSSAIIDQCATLKEENLAEKLFLRQLKFVALCNAIGMRVAPNLYKSAGWHTSKNPEPIDEIIDLLAECSAIMEQVDHFFHTGAAASSTAHKTGNRLLLLCLSLERSLHRVGVSMQTRLGLPTVLPLHTISQGDLRAPLVTDIFPPAFQFPSLTCAESHLVYWTTLILLYPLIGQLLTVVDSSGTDVLTPQYLSSLHGKVPAKIEPSTVFTGLADHYADQVCRSVLYCIQPDMKTLGAQVLLAPLSQCVQLFHVEESTQKLKWCQMVLMALPGLGLGIAPFLKDMVWPKYRSAAQRNKSASPQAKIISA